MTSTISSTNVHYINPMLHQYKKRVMLKRSTHQINDPFVVQQKYSSNRKSVRFHDDQDQLEQVRYFYKTQSPLSVKSDPPSMDTSAEDYKLTQPNWPTRNQIFYCTDNKIRMEAVQLIDGDVEHMTDNKLVLQGRCRAANLSFHKLVSIRYTLDLWRTFSEITGEYRESIASTSNTWDRFYFSIPVEAKQATQTIYFALRYTVGDQEYWDNNNGMNYQVIMTPDESSTDTKQTDTSKLMDNKQEQASITNNTPTSTFTTSTVATDNTARENKETTKILGRRYDFTASLTAARKPLSPPPSPPGTPVDTEIFNYTPPVFFGDSNQFDAAPAAVDAAVTYQKSEPIAIASKPPASPPISAEGYQMSYSDFVNKYCFYNSHSNPIYSTFSTSPSAVLS
ncbi:putative phosphatase regulatory subunit-domain-containing protein [Parasitella parasitica]|nr:putative phosphatase regulatory subunit-domain-containing protein [Parasitella parasitica]